MTPRWCGAAGDRSGAVGWSASAVPAPAGGAAVGRDMQDVVPESRRVPAAAAVAMCGTSSASATMPVSGASGRDTPTGASTPEKV